MKNDYKDINFDAFVVEPERQLTKDEENSYIKNFYKSTGLSKSTKKKGSAINGFGRKFVALVATLVVVLAFGAVAYANGWFNLGVINSKYEEYEIIAMEDSNQYKAAKEVMDHYNTLPKDHIERTIILNGRGDLDEDANVMTLIEPFDEVKKVLKKYDLEYERNHYYVDTAEEALEYAGVKNFIGDFYDINKLKTQSTDTFMACDLYYTDKGSVMLSQGESWSMDPIAWELNCIPKNVYISPTHAFLRPNEKEHESFQGWQYTTKDGYYSQVATYKDSSEVLFDDGTDGTYIYQHFKCLIPLEKYTIEFNYNIRLEKDSPELTKGEFETIIEKFDFDKLN